MSFAFCKVLSCLLLQHDTADNNAVWNLRSRIWFRSNQQEKLLLTYLYFCDEMSLFSYIARFFSYRRHNVSFTLQLIWGNAIFVNVVAGVFTLSFMPRIVLTKFNNHIIPYFLVLWKIYRLWEPWMTVLFLHRNNSLVCFHCHLHFRRCLQRSQAQQQKICTREKPNFWLNKKIHISVE